MEGEMATVFGKGENLIAGKVLTLGSLTLTEAPGTPDKKPSESRSGANRGIRNLLVVCYDVDPNLVISPNDPAPAPEDIEGIVLEQAVGPSFWAKFPGQRLGSTLTDANGDWSLVYQDDLQTDAEPPRRIARPDLLIFVLAPEDTHEQLHDYPSHLPGLKELWVPDVVPQRVLHFSRELRLNAGRLEHYVIRIDDDLLEAAGLTDWIAPGDSTESLDRSLDDFFARRDRLLDRLRVRRRDEFSALAAIRERVRGRFTVDFMRSATFAPGGPPYIGAAETSTPALVIHSVGGVVAGAIDTVRAVPEDSQQRRFRFRLTDREAQDAGLLSPGRDALLGAVHVDWLMQRYSEATSGQALLASGSPLARCHNERLVDDAITKVMAPAPAHELPAAEPRPPLFSYDLNTQIEKLIGQMAEPAFKAEELVTERLDSTSLEQRLDGVELKPGPADVTAYHHFHRLELALPHIWTELFDDGIRSRGEELYAQVVRTQEDLGAEGYTATIESMEDSRQLMEVAQGLAPGSGGDAGTPDDIRVMFPGMTGRAWGLLDTSAQTTISSKALELNIAQVCADDTTATEETRQSCRDQAARLRREVDEIVRTEISEAVHLTRRDPLSRLMLELAERLAAPYKFTVFAPNTVNFGLLVTYRQAWRPISYQVGRLVKTIPLAPGEAREYSIKSVEKKSRNEKEIENNLRVKKSESESKGTIESQIASKASNRTNWKLSAEGSGSVGVFSASASAGMDGSAESASEDSKKSMREAVQKANEEDKKEHTWEVSTTQETQLETSESVKISNPNQEIPVTYLLYELQRRYGICEKLHAVQPVVLVANDVPPPHEVDEDFLIAHDWIIRRALLDDEFMAALNYLSEGFAGDEFRIEVLRHARKTRQDTLDDLRHKLEPYDLMLSEAGEKAAAAVRAVQRWTREDEEDDVAAARIGSEAAREQLQRLLQERADVKSLIDRASADLAEAEKALADALQTHANMKTEITRLRVHVAQNIIYYMQAIWETEHPDQRYFRLYNVLAPTIPFPRERPDRSLRSRRDPLTRDWVCETSLPPPDDFPVPPPPPEPPPASWQTLGEIADLDNLLGYKGNYMIFPLKNASDREKGNYLTAFMAQSYVSDSGKGAGDPDPAGGATLDELISYFRCIKAERERARGESPPASVPRLEDDEPAKDVMRELIKTRIVDPYTNEQELIVRTDSLFIEALPGSHPVLEDFKLRHRALDVQKVGAELRGQELENLRLAERLRSGEREDPRVDKRVEVRGATVLSVTEPDGPTG
jgi:hypothetical protein